jgi:hypothetical protein
MPWILYSLRRAWAGENRFLLAAILCGSCQMMTGAPELILASWGISLGFGLGLWLDKQICFSGLAWRSLLVVCSVAGLSAMQILPFLDLLQASVRDSQFANNKWAMPATGWANFFVPMAFTQAGTNGIRFPTGQDFVPSYYLGIGTCVLAITALIRTKRNSVRLPGFFAALAVVMALGDHGFLHPILKKLLPWLGVSRYPVKYLFFTLFAMPILVAEAIHLLGETPDKAKRCLWTVGAGIFCVVMGVTWFAFRYPQLGSSMDDFQATFRSALQSLLWLSAFLACLAWLFSSVPAIDAVHRWSAPTACILVGLDLLTHAPNINPTIPSDTFVPGLIRQNPPPKLGESRGMQSAHAFVLLYQACLPNPLTNFLSNRLAMQGNLNLLEDLPKVNGFYALNLREYEGIHNLLYSENSPEWPQLQKFLSASQITKPGTLFEWIPNTNFSPLITCGQRPVFTDSNPVQDLTNSSLDLSRIVLLPKSAKNFIQATNPAGGKIVTSTFKAHRITAETESDQPAWVVISQIFHRNWQAYVDGQPVPLWRANHAFQALEVPGGRHQVVLQYEDGSFRLGLVISLGTGLLLVLPMAYKPLRNRWLDRQDGNPVKAVV